MTKELNNLTFDNRVLGVIPARGGSKSIPLKNIFPLAGKPLIEYVITAAKRSKQLTQTVCSTDHPAIQQVCTAHNIFTFERPTELGQDDTPIASVLIDLLNQIAKKEGSAPGMIALLQPTSPFVRPDDIDSCIQMLQKNLDADSAQTVTSVHHNAHAFNQRVIEEGMIRFRFPEERRIAYNKQRKAKHYLFGNLVVTRSSSLVSQMDCFGKKSIPLEIPSIYAIDLDGPHDVEYAEYLINEKKVPTLEPCL